MKKAVRIVGWNVGLAKLPLVVYLRENFGVTDGNSRLHLLLREKKPICLTVAEGDVEAVVKDLEAFGAVVEVN
ncbi:hypothetical protein [Boseongicola sp. H5]|uniref:hypothetical protein n=1 Tax=Boseongicola sp. H5 TaxID=2763261 RepID=UPI001D0A64FA|nr:hypothetical protein [Boseongicola sp. H5]